MSEESVGTAPSVISDGISESVLKELEDILLSTVIPYKALPSNTIMTEFLGLCKGKLLSFGIDDRDHEKIFSVVKDSLISKGILERTMGPGGLVCRASLKDKLRDMLLGLFSECSEMKTTLLIKGFNECFEKEFGIIPEIKYFQSTLTSLRNQGKIRAKGRGRDSITEKVDSPPPKVDSPPPKVDSPPPKVDSPPPKVDSPPPKVDLPEEEDDEIEPMSEKERESYRKARIVGNLRAYLGSLFLPLSKEDVDLLNKVFPPRLCSIYLRGDNNSLRKAAMYLLVRDKTIRNYAYITVSKLLDLYLGKDENGELEGDPNRRSHINFSSPILILHYVRNTIVNRSAEPLMCQVVAERSNRGLITIVLDEANLTVIRETMRSFKILLIEKSIMLSQQEIGKTGTVRNTSERRGPL